MQPAPETRLNPSDGLPGKDIVCLEDIVSEQQDDASNACAEILRRNTILSVRGNHDDYVFIRRSAHMSKSTQDYLSSLPEYVQIGDFFVIHDTPILSTREGECF